MPGKKKDKNTSKQQSPELTEEQLKANLAELDRMRIALSKGFDSLAKLLTAKVEDLAVPDMGFRPEPVKPDKKIPPKPEKPKKPTSEEIKQRARVMYDEHKEQFKDFSLLDMSMEEARKNAKEELYGKYNKEMKRYQNRLEKHEEIKFEHAEYRKDKDQYDDYVSLYAEQMKVIKSKLGEDDAADQLAEIIKKAAEQAGSLKNEELNPGKLVEAGEELNRLVGKAVQALTGMKSKCKTVYDEVKEEKLKNQGERRQLASQGYILGWNRGYGLREKISTATDALNKFKESAKASIDKIKELAPAAQNTINVEAQKQAIRAVQVLVEKNRATGGSGLFKSTLRNSPVKNYEKILKDKKLGDKEKLEAIVKAAEGKTDGVHKEIRDAAMVSDAAALKTRLA